MKTARKRFNVLLSFIFYTTYALLLAIFLSSSLIVRKRPIADLRILEYKNYGKNFVVSFQHKIDLSDQFSFNLKQVFVYLKAIYPDMGNSSEIIWSKIITRKGEKKLNGISRSTYDIVGDLTKKTVFELRGNYFPFVGMVRDVLFCRTEVDI